MIGVTLLAEGEFPRDDVVLLGEGPPRVVAGDAILPPDKLLRMVGVEGLDVGVEDLAPGVEGLTGGVEDRAFGVDGLVAVGVEAVEEDDLDAEIESFKFGVDALTEGVEVDLAVGVEGLVREEFGVEGLETVATTGVEL